jgi:hypothetical protein
VQSAVEEKSSGDLGEESERKTERRVRGETDRRGYAVRGFMTRATKRRGVSRSFPRRAGEASRCALQSLALWKRSIQRYPQNLCGGCFNMRADLENKEAQKSNKRPIGSPGPSSTLHRRPWIAGFASARRRWPKQFLGTGKPRPLARRPTPRPAPPPLGLVWLLGQKKPGKHTPRGIFEGRTGFPLLPGRFSPFPVAIWLQG